MVQVRKNKQKIAFQVFFFSIVTLCFAVICYRSVFIDITHDEAFSFFLVKTNNINALVTTANTHWFNTLWIKIVALFGLNQVYFLRLLSIFSFLLFAFFNFRLLQFIKSYKAQILFVFVVFCNPFILEFFSLARGYALSLSFFMAVLFYTLQFIEHPKTSKYFLLILLFGILSIIANYTAIFPIVSLFVYLLVIKKASIIKLFREKRVKWSIALFLFTIVGAGVNMLMIKFISNDLQYGADHSFMTETLNSIFLFIAFHPFPVNSHVLFYLVSGFSVFWFLLTFFILGKANRYQNSKMGLGPSIFFIAFVFSYVAHFLFSTPFPLGRTAILLVPSMIITLVFWFDSTTWKPITSAIFLVAFCGVVSFFTVSKFSLKHTLEWRNQAEATLVFDDVLKQSTTTLPISVLSDESYYAVWKNYYSQINPDKYFFNYAVLDKSKKISKTEFTQLVKGNQFFIVTKPFNYSYYQEMPQLKLFRYYSNSETWIYCVENQE
jgi:hypothetical protein